MKISPVLVLCALFVAVWSCKPRDTRTTSDKPADAPAEITAPQPAPTPDPPPQPDTSRKLKVGDEVTLDAVKAATWLQGTPPGSFEPGKVYIFEAWATWCGPCIRSIPHLNQLHQKYQDRGLKIYGMNVFENDPQKVAAFVEKKRGEMTYPVAFTGRGSLFDTHWMKASDTRGIPQSFVVIDGILVLKTHPAKLTEEFIDKLLKGGRESTQALNEMNLGNAAQREMQETMKQFQQATMKGDSATMESIVADLEKQDPGHAYLHPMKTDLLLAKRNWSQLDAALIDSPSSPTEITTIKMIGSRLGLSESHSSEAPPELLAKAAKSFAASLSESKQSNPMEWMALSSLQFKTGDPDAAKASARTAAELAGKAPRGHGAPPAAFEKFAAEVEAGRLPTIDEFTVWLKDSLQKKP